MNIEIFIFLLIIGTIIAYRVYYIFHNSKPWNKEHVVKGLILNKVIVQGVDDDIIKLEIQVINQKGLPLITKSIATIDNDFYSEGDEVELILDKNNLDKSKIRPNYKKRYNLKKS